VACADLRLAQWKVGIARDEAAIQQRFTALARSREEVGDISELEVSTAEVDSIQARISRDRSPVEVKLATETLRHLLGLSNQRESFSLSQVPVVPDITRGGDELVALALAARPDLRVAEMQIEAAGKRFGLSQAEVFQVSAIFDSNGDGTAFESGPGLDLTLPVFHRNQGAKALEDARFQKACRHYRAVEDQIAMEVRQSFASYEQADRDLQRIRDELLPALRRNRIGAEKAWKGGEVEYLFVLDVNRKMQAARLAEAEATAELLRAVAELQRSIGANVSTLSDKVIVSTAL
jgi:cobalt-zinc-cadmium efflux system outer membrane protein